MPSLYHELDQMAATAGKILMESGLFEPDTLLVRFDKADEEDIAALVMRNPQVMVPFFVTICGFSEREMSRLYGIRDVYSLCERVNKEKVERLARAVKDNLKHPLGLETVIYKFYKNWEEHQKRQRRGREAERLVAEVLEKHGYRAGKLTVVCNNREREIDLAIPPDRDQIRVAIMIRYGVYRDLIKRAKEFSAEFDELLSCYPDIKFVVVYFVSPHEKELMEKIRAKIEREREGKRPYDAVILTLEELEGLVEKLREWKIPKGP